MQFSDEILNLCAPRLAGLSASDAPAVPELPDYRHALRLRQVLGPTRYRDPNVFVSASIFVARLDVAIREYRAGRERLLEYVAGLPEHDRLSSHGRAIAHFETSILHAHVMVASVRRFVQLLGADAPPQVRGDDYDRLRELSNRIKHFDDDLDEARASETLAPSAPLWLTNTELCCDRTSLTYVSFAAILVAQSDDARVFCVEMLTP